MLNFTLNKALKTFLLSSFCLLLSCSTDLTPRRAERSRKTAIEFAQASSLPVEKGIAVYCNQHIANDDKVLCYLTVNEIDYTLICNIPLSTVGEDSCKQF